MMPILELQNILRYGPLILSLTLLVSHAIYPAAADTHASRLKFEPCKISDPTGKYRLSAECAILQLPENSLSFDLLAGAAGASLKHNTSAPSSDRLIGLHITRLKSRNLQSKADPFTLIAGGPGQSASESWPSISFAFQRIRKERDIYLIDQRGTGRSGKLICAEDSATMDPFTFDAEAVATASQECRQALQADPRYYTTSIAVQDLELARKALGVSQWNIYGISYGTRVALHYLRRFPDSVRTLILDAVVPPDVSLGASVGPDAKIAFEQMLARCEANSDCQQNYPDLAAKTAALIDRLRIEPITIQYENFNSGKLESMNFNLNHLMLTLRMLTYTSHGVSILPNMLREAYENENFAPFARQASMQVTELGDSLASGMHTAVVCTEDEPFIDIADIDAGDISFLGDDAINALRATCLHWQPGIMDSDFRTPVVSDKPVLIFSGGADPVTPAHYGEQVAATLSSSLHITNPMQGHMQAVLGCTPIIIANFITRGNTQDIDFGCLERLRPEPFFIDANGPMP